MLVTRCADTLVMLPVAASCAVWLWYERAWHMAWRWIMLFGLGLVLVVASKIAFIGWGVGIQAIDFTGFSGHAMRAAAVLPVLFYLVTQTITVKIRRLLLLLSLLLGGVLAYSRLVLQVHSLAEVVSGYLLGSLVALEFIRRAQPVLPAASVLFGSGRDRYIHQCVLLGLILIGLIPASLHGPAPTEHWLQKISLALSGHSQPFTRAMWQAAPKAVPTAVSR